MEKTRIDLSQPFEEILATVLSLPRALDPTRAKASREAAEMKQLVRGLYEAANGRQVETQLGLVPIAPPVAPFLKELPFEVETQLDFLVEAMSRSIAGPSEIIEAASVPETIGSSGARFKPLPANGPVEEREIASRFVAQQL